ncbi:MAG: HAD-IA family hydrolase [Acidobacteriota bacterium]
MRTQDSPLQTIFFDAVGTLFRVRGSVGQIYAQLAAEFGFPTQSACGPGRINRAFSKALRERTPIAFGDISAERLNRLERAWWLALVRATFAPLGPFPRLEEFFDRAYAFFAGSEAWVLEPGCPQMLEELKRRGLRMGVISNFDSRLVQVLKGLGIASFFDGVTVSSRSPAAKPNPLIFQEALAITGAEARTSLHIGDDWEDDFQGARHAGLRALLYDPEDCFPALGGDRIRRLDDVTRLPAWTTISGIQPGGASDRQVVE